MDRRRCKACARVCRYIEDDRGADWEAIIAWGRFKRTSCPEGLPPYYQHMIPENQQQGEINGI